MVSRLRPLSIKLAFDRRRYKLGETVDVSVDLSPNGDIDVREGRVDLICEMHYTEATTVMVASNRGAAYGVPIQGSPRQVTAENEETYTQGSAVFIQNTRLRSGTTSAYRIVLEIPQEPPANVAGSSTRSRATLKWSVVASIDVAQARDVTASRAVNVLVQPSSGMAGEGKLTPEQRRENARKAAKARWAKARGRG